MILNRSESEPQRRAAPSKASPLGGQRDPAPGRPKPDQPLRGAATRAAVERGGKPSLRWSVGAEWLSRGLVVLLMLMGLLLSACSKDDPQARLEATVRQFQESIEAKDAGSVMDLVDARFRMQGDLDAERAQKTMMVIFHRYANIKVFAVGHQTRIDPASPLTGYTEAQVLVTGAQGLIPERATPYTVRMEWRLVDEDWKLYDLKWE